MAFDGDRSESLTPVSERNRRPLPGPTANPDRTRTLKAQIRYFGSPELAPFYGSLLGELRAELAALIPAASARPRA